MVSDKTNSFSWCDVMKFRNELFGFSILWIIAFHIFRNVGIGNFGYVTNGLSLILSRGNMGVDIFLFLSAVGLSKSIQNNDTIHFYKHRIKRVVLPYLLMAIPFFIWYDFIYYKDGFYEYIYNVATVNFWLNGKHPVWYVAFILVLYLIFPLLHRWDKKTHHVSTICIIVICVLLEFLMCKTGFWLFRTSEKALSRIPVFMVGLMVAPIVLSERRIPLKLVLFMFIIGIGLFAFISLRPPYLVLIRYIYCPISIAIILCYTYYRRKSKTIWIWNSLAWIGALSFELYIVHILIRRVVTVTDSWEMFNPVFWWFFIPAVSLPLALALHFVSDRINNCTL